MESATLQTMAEIEESNLMESATLQTMAEIEESNLMESATLQTMAEIEGIASKLQTMTGVSIKAP